MKIEKHTNSQEEKKIKKKKKEFEFKNLTFSVEFWLSFIHFWIIFVSSNLSSSRSFCILPFCSSWTIPNRFRLWIFLWTSVILRVQAIARCFWLILWRLIRSTWSRPIREMVCDGGDNGGGDETPTLSPRSKLKFLCSYGGKILPRPADGHLKYVGGETRVIAIPRDIKFSGFCRSIFLQFLLRSWFFLSFLGGFLIWWWFCGHCENPVVLLLIEWNWYDFFFFKFWMIWCALCTRLKLLERSYSFVHLWSYSLSGQKVFVGLEQCG